MACVDPSLCGDDDEFALQLQLQEIDSNRELQSGKWKEDDPPDFAIAFNEFEAELKRAIDLLQDLKVAHSIAKAVDADAAAIAELKLEEAQSANDHNFARSLNEAPHTVPQCSSIDQTVPDSDGEWVDWDHVFQATQASTLSEPASSVGVGPSKDYALRQRAILEHIPQLMIHCSVCGDLVHPHHSVRLVCNDVFCKPCLKNFCLRVTRDETLFPPKCHRAPIDISAIEAALSSEELASYREAEQEYTSGDRVYCANAECARFIPLRERGLDQAPCQYCGAATCMHCKALAHEDDCLQDEGRQSLFELAGDEGWKRCFRCGAMVSRNEGCDHMTCRCKAEFCYRCSLPWKECSCGDWEPELLAQRARAVVEREAPHGLAPAARHQRVADMERVLRNNHECNHRGKFTRIEGGRRPYVCEMCAARHWVYILSCRHCHMLACEDCRRHRV